MQVFDSKFTQNGLGDVLYYGHFFCTTRKKNVATKQEVEKAEYLAEALNAFPINSMSGENFDLQRRELIEARDSWKEKYFTLVQSIESIIQDRR